METMSFESLNLILFVWEQGQIFWQQANYNIIRHLFFMIQNSGYIIRHLIFIQNSGYSSSLIKHNRVSRVWAGMTLWFRFWIKSWRRKVKTRQYFFNDVLKGYSIMLLPSEIFKIMLYSCLFFCLNDSILCKCQC